MARKFTYYVETQVWLTTGTGKPWRGEVTIDQAVVSSDGLAVLEAEVTKVVTAWARSQNLVSSGRVDLRSWRPKANK